MKKNDREEDGVKSKMEIKVHFNVNIPRVPNYLLIGNGDEKIPLSAVTEDGLREIGKQWTEDLVARAKQMEKDGIV